MVVCSLWNLILYNSEETVINKVKPKSRYGPFGNIRDNLFIIKEYNYEDNIESLDMWNLNSKDWHVHRPDMLFK